MGKVIEQINSPKCFLSFDLYWSIYVSLLFFSILNLSLLNFILIFRITWRTATLHSANCGVEVGAKGVILSQEYLIK